MPKSGGQEGEIALPPGWDFGRDYDNKLYFIDHNTQKTTWVDPRDSLTKPQSFADCVGDELPVGWEQVLDINRGVYYVNHVEKKVQIEDPRLQWRALQEEMLRQFLVLAQDDLTNKQELVNVKQARLSLAQDEFQHLNTTLSALSNSTTSLNSTSSSSSTKYDPDLLKSDVHHAKARVHRLRRELANINSEMDFKQRGVETLQNVNTKFLDNGRGLTIEEAKAVRAELLSIQQSLSTGEQEKIELMKSLACLKDDLTRLQPSESSLDVSVINEKFSTASQTDLSGEMVPVGARLAELARLRLQYDESRRTVQEIQQQLAALEERISPGQLESDKDRLLLIQEKEQLLRELRSINLRNRSNAEMNDIRQKIRQLECDLNNAMEVSNKCIADRLKIHEDKQFLLQQLKDSMRELSTLESQLKLLSASTLSMSSSSSLGSLSSSHASSKGSLSSLSFTDIYGMSTIAQQDSSMLDLHRRVEKILEGSHQQQCDGAVGGDEGYTQPGDGATNLCLPNTSSQLSLSPRSSLSSVSPPVSPYHAAVMPPSYDQAYLTSVERHKRLQTSLPHLSQSNPSHVHLHGASGAMANLEDQFSGLGLSRAAGVPVSVRPRQQRPAVGQFDLNSGETSYCLTPSQAMLHRRSGQDSVGSDQSNQSAPLSPISETTTDDRKTVSSNTRSGVSGVSAAVSDESVAGDSGVFEASNKRDNIGLSTSLETTQVQIKLRYSTTDQLLHVGIERARNLSALFVPEGRKVCIKAALLPAIANVMCTFCTRAISDLSKPTFGENFPIAITKTKLVAKTLQVNVWAIDINTGREDCLGSAQVSMADFKTSTTSVKWYNVLSFHFMQQEVKKPSPTPRHVAHVTHHVKQDSDVSTVTNSRQGTLKEESSDESTIISSQTSTLTRNIGPEAMLGHADSPAGVTMEGVITVHVENDDDEEDEEAEEESEEVDFMINENTDSLIFPVKPVPNVDAETNTECVFIQQPVIGRKSSDNILSRLGAASASSVKRSKTFGPSAPIAKSQYNCRLNRSDSDSAMPLYRKVPFQRSSKERRSLHVPSSSSRQQSKSSKSSTDMLTKTSIDLELDLAAQQSKLVVLSEELERLRQIKKQMEEAKEKGEKELPVWLQEDDQFQYLLASLEDKSEHKSSEERRMEKLLRKTAKEIYKLRKSKSLKGQLDVQSFKEKMAFFTSVKANVPIYHEESDDDTCSESSTLQSSRIMTSSSYSTPTPTVDTVLRECHSTETVSTITEEDTASSQNSTPTPNLQTERFSYDIDPELGAFV